MFCKIVVGWEAELRPAALSVALEWVWIFRTEGNENVEDPERNFSLS